MKTRCSALVVILLVGCSETTRTQRDYATSRDDCREYSEARRGLPLNGGEKDEKTKLLALFADCMNKRGWAVSAPGNEKPAAETPKAEKPVAGKPGVISYYVPPMPMAQGANFGTDRASACAYARHARNHSTLAREVARDCDNECNNASTVGWSDACPKAVKKY